MSNVKALEGPFNKRAGAVAPVTVKLSEGSLAALLSTDCSRVISPWSDGRQTHPARHRRCSAVHGADILLPAGEILKLETLETKDRKDSLLGLTGAITSTSYLRHC